MSPILDQIRIYFKLNILEKYKLLASDRIYIKIINCGQLERETIIEMGVGDEM